MKMDVCDTITLAETTKLKLTYV